MENKDYTRFSCCAYWQQCDLGRGDCVFNDTEPNIKSFCGAYLNRDFRDDLQQETVSEQIEIKEPMLFEQPSPEPVVATMIDEDLFIELEGTPLAPNSKSTKKTDFIESNGQFTLF